MAMGPRDTSGRITIEASLEELDNALRLFLRLQDGARLEERGMTVGDRAEADREVTAFATRFPGIAIERVGDGWRQARNRRAADARAVEPPA